LKRGSLRKERMHLSKSCLLPFLGLLALAMVVVVVAIGVTLLEN